MFITFNILRFKNFLSYGNSFTEIVLDSHTCTIISGKNGEGKSTALDAIMFGLFGKPYRPGVNIPQLVNSVNRSEAVVELEFTIESTKYKIIRGLKPAIFEIYRNGEIIQQPGSTKDYQDMLEHYILGGLTPEIFTQVVMFGKAFSPFMTLPAKSRRDIIENLLGITVLSGMKQILKGISAENAAQVADQKRENHAALYRKETYEKFHATNAGDVETRLQKINSEHTELMRKLEASIVKVTELDAEYTKMQQENPASMIVKTQEQLDSINKIITKIEQNIELTQREIDFFSNHTECPTCKQLMAAEHTANHICTRETHIGKYEKGLNAAFEKKESIRAVLADLRVIETNKQTLRTNKTLAEQERNSIKAQLVKNQSQIDDCQNILTKLLVDSKSELSAIDTSILITTENLRKLTNKQSSITIAEDILKDTGIRSNIVETYLPMINSKINSNLESMQLPVSFNLNSVFVEEIKSRYRDTFSYGSFSAGQQARIDAAILLTWRDIAKFRNSISCNLLILDEIFDGAMDSDATDDLLKLICYSQPGTNSIIITHKVIEGSGRGKSDRQLEAKMIGEFSTLTQMII